jgi:hypothetical protein
MEGVEYEEETKDEVMSENSDTLGLEVNSHESSVGEASDEETIEKLFPYKSKLLEKE